MADRLAGNVRATATEGVPMWRRMLALTAIAALALGCSDSSSPAPTKAAVTSSQGPSTAIDPADFVRDVTNPYFPLAPGEHWSYRTSTDEGTELNEVVVLASRRRIQGVDAVVVHDTVSVGGDLTEDTYDWYAQDRDGAVWYLGEDTKELEHGTVTSTEGSWEAGKDGAHPGVIMQAHPAPGPWYWQEYLRGEAEDQARVVRVDGATEVPAGRYDHLVVVDERSPLEPKLVERKYYAKGVGVVLDRTTKGPREVSVLVRRGSS